MWFSTITDGPGSLFITRVELRNIKNHADSAYTFQPGVVSICGPNGSGKTTILEAIAWALFDYLEYRREDFVRRGAKKGQVTVGFVSDLDEREYLVTRDTAGAYFVYDPVTKTRLVEQKNQVLPWLRQRLGVEAGTDLAVLFRTTIGVPQGTFTHDFMLPPANRKAIFDQILRVEEYRQAADTLRGPQRMVETRVIEADRQLSRYDGELVSWDETRRDLDLAQERLIEIEGRLESARVEREQLEAAVRRFEEERQLLDRQRSICGELELRLAALTDSLQSGQELCRQAAEAARVVGEAREGWRQYLEAASRIETLERRREVRDHQRGRLNLLEHRLIEAESLERQAGERLKEVARFRAEAEPLVIEAERQRAYEQELLRLRECRGEAQSLQMSRDRLDDELRKLRARYQLLTGQIDEARRLSGEAGSIDSLEAERTRLEEERQRLRVAREARLLKQEELDRLDDELTRRRAEEQRRRGEMVGLETLAPLAGELSSLEERWNEQLVRLARSRAELARDQEMIKGLESGGRCPLLNERCRNLGDGESLDHRFRSGIQERQVEIAGIEQETERQEQALREARQAAQEYSRLSRELAILEGQIAEREDLERRIGRTRDELTTLPADAAELERLAATRLREIDSELRAARESQRLIDQAEVLAAERASLQREGEIRRIEFDRVESRLVALGDVDVLIEEAQQALESLGDPRSRLLALGQTIDREPQLLAEAEQARDSAAAIRLEIEPLTLELHIFETLDLEMSEASQQRAAHQADYLQFIANEQLAATLESRQSEVRQLEFDSDQLRQARDESRLRLSSLETSYDPALHRNCHLNYDHTRELVTRLISERDHLAAQVLALSSRLDSLSAIREQQSRLAVERDKLSQLGRKTELIREILVKSAPFITESYLFSISHEANQLYREITGCYDITLRWTREYEILLEESGYDRPFSNLSGGEQMAAALAVRLALLRELSEINLAIFDEPTTNMDEERRRNLALQLGRISDFHQLFVISHDDSFEGLTDQQVSLGRPS